MVDDLRAAIERAFGPMCVDLCADGTPTCHQYLPSASTLSSDWAVYTGNLWLMSSAHHQRVLAEKCVSSSPPGNYIRKVFWVTPARVCADWYDTYVHEMAYVLPLIPSRGMMLCVFGATPAFAPWRWKASV